MRTNSCVKPLLERRSIRSFKDKPVSAELLLKAVDIARHAPSAHNRQPWKFIVITRRDTLRELADAAPGGAPLYEAPAGIAVIGDVEAAPHTYLIDCSVAATYLWLALHCLGLGAVWIEMHGNRRAELILHTPPGKRVVAIFAVGWPAEKPKPPSRKSLEEVTYLEDYGRPIKI